MTPQQFAAAMRHKATAVKTAVIAAERETVKETARELVKGSSGSLTSGQLARAGHPYARRAPNSSYDPATINAQTGKFRASWVKSGPVSGGGSLRSSVVNTDPVAKYMMGTRRMVARRLDTAVAARMKPVRMARLRAAMRAR
jgi:hypothetical protein